GQPVQFDTLPSGKGVHAINIIPLDAEGRPLTESSAEQAQEAPVAAQKAAHSEEKETEIVSAQFLTLGIRKLAVALTAASFAVGMTNVTHAPFPACSSGRCL